MPTYPLTTTRPTRLAIALGAEQAEDIVVSKLQYTSPLLAGQDTQDVAHQRNVRLTGRPLSTPEADEVSIEMLGEVFFGFTNFIDATPAEVIALTLPYELTDIEFDEAFQAKLRDQGINSSDKSCYDEGIQHLTAAVQHLDHNLQVLRHAAETATTGEARTQTRADLNAEHDRQHDEQVVTHDIKSPRSHATNIYKLMSRPSKYFALLHQSLSNERNLPQRKETIAELLAVLPNIPTTTMTDFRQVVRMVGPENIKLLNGLVHPDVVFAEGE